MSQFDAYRDGKTPPISRDTLEDLLREPISGVPARTPTPQGGLEPGVQTAAGDLDQFAGLVRSQRSDESIRGGPPTPGNEIIAPDAPTPAAFGLSEAIAQHAARHGGGLAALARQARISPAQLQLLSEGETLSIEASTIEVLATALRLKPSQLREYRLAIVLDSLVRHSERLDLLFLETLSPIERNLIGDAVFSTEPLGPTVWRLLAEHELTQQELAEGIGLTQSAVSRAMNGHERLSMDDLETIAQALDAAPELFVEYRLRLVEEWLWLNQERTDKLFEELNWDLALGGYESWRARKMPDPRKVEPRALLQSLLEIIDAEGPVLGARVYELRLEAAGLTETKDLRSLLNRATAALSRAGQLVDENESGEQTQKYRIFRLPGQPRIVPRVLGERRLWQVPQRELMTVIRATPAWKRGESVGRIQNAVLVAYGLSGISMRDGEHLNRCITRSEQGGNA